MSLSELFVPQVPLVETFVRGTAVYLGLFLMMRFVLKRQSGTMGMTDLLFVVLVADASQNAMAGDYKTITDGLLLVAVLQFWEYALDWVAFRFPRVRPWIEPPPLVLVRHGKAIARNLRREMVSRDELMSQVRQQGLDSLEKVKFAFMEHDGNISIIPMDEKPHSPRRRPPT